MKQSTPKKRYLRMFMLQVIRVFILITSGLLGQVRCEECGVHKHMANRTTQDKVEYWPWTVAIALPVVLNYSRIFCTGVVLDKRTVLSSAHCFLKQEYYVLQFGKEYRQGDSEMELKSSVVHLHPDFNSTTFMNDIAVVKLDSDLKYSNKIMPICLPTLESSKLNLVPGNLGWVTSWGLDERQRPTERLKVTILPVQSERTCMDFFRRHGSIQMTLPGMFCAGQLRTEANLCLGDSGAPIVFYNVTSELYTLEGLASFTTSGFCGYQSYMVFSEVSAYLPWIEKHLEELL